MAIGDHMHRVVVIEMYSVLEGKDLARKIEDELALTGQIMNITISNPTYGLRYVKSEDL